MRAGLRRFELFFRDLGFPSGVTELADEWPEDADTAPRAMTTKEALEAMETGAWGEVEVWDRLRTRAGLVALKTAGNVAEVLRNHAIVQATPAGATVTTWGKLARFEIETRDLDAPHPWTDIAAGEALESNHDDPLAALPDAEDLLERATRRHLAAWVRRLKWPEVDGKPWPEVAATRILPNGPWKTPDLDAAAELEAGALEDTPAGPVPWLSARFAEYLESNLKAPDFANAFRRLEAAREAERHEAALLPLEPPRPPPALVGWKGDEAPALVNLALVVWRGEVRPRLKEANRYPGAAMMLPLALGAAKPPRLTRDGRLTSGPEWELSALPADVLDQVAALGVLNTACGQAVLRGLPELARLAAGRECCAREFTDEDRAHLWLGKAGQVRAETTFGYRTEVHAEGGYSALAEMLGVDRRELPSVLEATFRWPLRWQGNNARGIATLVGDLVENSPGGGQQAVSFILPCWLHPAYPATLKEDRHSIRAVVFYSPSLPPVTSDRLQGPGSRLEMEALGWLRERVATLDPKAGAAVPWEELAEEVGLSSAKEKAKRRKVLQGTLDLWVKEGRWVATEKEKHTFWRPADAIWRGFLEAQSKSQDGTARARRAKKTGRKRGK